MAGEMKTHGLDGPYVILEEKTCQLRIEAGGKVKTCGGGLKSHKIYPPFTNQTPIGGPPQRHMLSFNYCDNCRVMYFED